MDEHDAESDPVIHAAAGRPAVSVRVKPERLGGAASAIPSFLGMIASAGLGWVVYDVFGIGIYTALATLFVAGVWWMEWRYLYAMHRAMEYEQHPAALTVALSQRVRALPIRVWLSVWWGGHVLLTLSTLVALMVVNFQVRARAASGLQWESWFMIEVVVFWLTYSAVGHLLMAISCWPVQAEVLIRIWRIRFWLSFLATLVGFAALIIAVI